MVSDNGIGMPEALDWQECDSLGLKLVKTIAEDQLDGSIALNCDHGTQFTIRFKIENQP